MTRLIPVGALVTLRANRSPGATMKTIEVGADHPDLLALLAVPSLSTKIVDGALRDDPAIIAEMRHEILHEFLEKSLSLGDLQDGVPTGADHAPAGPATPMMSMANLKVPRTCVRMPKDILLFC